MHKATVHLGSHLFSRWCSVQGIHEVINKPCAEGGEFIKSFIQPLVNLQWIYKVIYTAISEFAVNLW